MRSLLRYGLLGAVLVLVSVGTAAGQGKEKGKAKMSSSRNPVTIQAKCEANGLTQPEITELLASQNKVRAELRLPPFTWNCTLANVAQQWAARGVFTHRTDTTFGENLFVSSNPAMPIGIAVKAWLAEKQNWTNKTAQCTPGKVCTHYTQMVWNTTTLIGCGVNRNADGQWKTLLVCNYSPAGNSGGPAF